MEPEAYDRFTEQLTDWARHDPRVTGLIAMGSMAGTSRRADRWSDHDFFVVTVDGAAEALRTDRTWLPDADRIVVHFRETVHGSSATYDDGHLAEFAVFESAELDEVKANDHRVLVDDGSLAGRMAAIVAKTTEEAATHDPDGRDRFGSFCAQLVIGLTRYGRGERLSANHLVRGWALRSLLALVETFVEPTGPGAIDNLDPHRRFELAYPDIGRELDEALILPVPRLSARLLDVCEREVAPAVPTATPAAFAALRAVAARASG